MVRHPAWPSASLLALGVGHNAGEDGFLVELVARELRWVWYAYVFALCGGCLFSDHVFVVRNVFPFSFCVGESVAFALDGLGHPPPRRGELLEYNL